MQSSTEGGRKSEKSKIKLGMPKTKVSMFSLDTRYPMKEEVSYKTLPPSATLGVLGRGVGRGPIGLAPVGGSWAHHRDKTRRSLSSGVVDF